MDEQVQRVAAAFSRKAAIYDEFGREHPNLERMRRKFYAHVGRTIPTGCHLLELNAGTGLDALALVERGYRVHATDIAPGMLAEIQRKIERYSLHDRLTAQACSFTELDRVEGGPFDGVISNSGGLNCVDDLTLVTRHLPRLLKPGGVAVWTIMPPVCPWELARTFKDGKTATRRPRGQVTAHVEGADFLTTYYTPYQVRRALGADFSRLRLEGLSVVTPPADNGTFAICHPALYGVLARMDDASSGLPPFKSWGDFFILSMRYVP